MMRKGDKETNVSMGKPKNTKKTLKKLLSLIAEFGWGYIIATLFSVAAVIFQVLGPQYLGKATNEIAAGVGRYIEGAGGLDIRLFTNILIKLGIAYLGSAVFNYLCQIILANVTQRLMYSLRERIQKKLNVLPLNYFDTNSLGDVLSRVTNDTDTLSNSLQNSLPNLIGSILTVIAILIAMFSTSWVLTVIALITLPLSFIVSINIMKRSQKFFRGQQQGLGDINGYIEEMYSGHDTIRAYNREENSIVDFDKINDKLRDDNRKAQLVSGLMMPATFFFGNLGYTCVSVVGGFLVIYKGFGVGNIQTFIQYLRQFNQPLGQISSTMNEFQATIAAAERVFGFLEEEEQPPDTTSPVKHLSAKGEVEMTHVKFGYSPTQPLITDLSIELKSGDKIALVGPTGAGKTTLVNLLLRFYDIQSGKITIDGIDIMDMTRNDLRSLFGMVLQDTWLYSGSIADNIRYGKLDASDEDVKKAAKAAHADSFIRTLPGGYDMVLEEDADNISGGQRQLLTIARAILSDPTILILDEATSSVDTRTELLIQKAMSNLMKDRTSFVIAHRLSTIKDSDVILVLNDGDIVETGTHDVLLAKNGFYANLYYSQLAGDKT